ncbi:MAG: hypothetical protein KGL31_02535 [candidate division NC10 bacterium]|nr:hypothetical protein [candidate division NC10 bacterium]MDE2320783.1 hypothetical protein [candidate division NC10 bacterium]
MRKGGENLNGSEEKGSTKEGDEEEVGTLLGLGDRIDPEKPEMKRLYVNGFGLIIGEELVGCLIGGKIPPAAGGGYPPQPVL